MTMNEFIFNNGRKCRYITSTRVPNGDFELLRHEYEYVDKKPGDRKVFQFEALPVKAAPTVRLSAFARKNAAQQVEYTRNHRKRRKGQ